MFPKLVGAEMDCRNLVGPEITLQCMNPDIVITSIIIFFTCSSRFCVLQWWVMLEIIRQRPLIEI